MAQGRFVNQKMGKKSGFAQQRAVGKTGGRRGMSQEKPGQKPRNERDIMKLPTIPSRRFGN